MILGCGIDNIEIERIRRILEKYSDRFLNRVFSRSEHKDNAKPAYYAKRFAAKEAALKAMGTGLQQGLNWHDLTLSSTDLGQPLIKLSDKGINLLRNKFVKPSGIFRFHVSLSDTKEYALAMVILESIQ